MTATGTNRPIAFEEYFPYYLKYKLHLWIYFSILSSLFTEMQDGRKMYRILTLNHGILADGGLLYMRFEL